jgi:hypothetical protein
MDKGVRCIFETDSIEYDNSSKHIDRLSKLKRFRREMAARTLLTLIAKTV